MKKYTLNILSTSDIHGYVLPINYSNNSEANIGLAKVATLVHQIRSEQPTLLIDNGDILQGSPLAYYNAQISKNNYTPFADVLNYMNYDVCVIGNHDFNYGIDYLNHYKDSLKCPLLSANITDLNGQFYSKPYIIKQLDGIKVAIIGVTTKYIPNWERKEYIKDLKFHDAFEKTKAMVDYIKQNEQVNCIVVSYHGGFERDLNTGEPTEELTGENQGYRMLAEIEGVDVLLTGHQHRSIAIGDVFGKAITQTANNGKEIGLVTLEFELVSDNWVLINKNAQLLNTMNVEADQYVIDLVKDVESETQNWLDQPLGTVKNGDLRIHDLFDARVNRHPLVRFINQVQMDASGAEISITSLANEISGFNQQITMRDINSTYVFPNTLVVLEVSGQDIKDALEKSANYFVIENEELTVNNKYIYPKPQHYNYDMYEGLDYEIHVRETLGSRVKNIKHKNEDLNLTKTYQVIMNNYRANGGGNFNMYKHKKVIKEITTDMVELLAEYVKKHRVIDIDPTSNIKIIY